MTSISFFREYRAMTSDTHDTLQDSAAARRDLANQRAQDAWQENAELRQMLRVILPMAKGYAAANPVGNNAEMIAEAEALLGRRTQ